MNLSLSRFSENLDFKNQLTGDLVPWSDQYVTLKPLTQLQRRDKDNDKSKVIQEIIQMENWQLVFEVIEAGE